MNTLTVPTSPKVALHNLRTKARVQQARRQQLWCHAVKDAERILQVLTTQFQPSRVWQWGSVLHAEHFQDYSDIDFAVEGICDPEVFFRLLRCAEQVTQFPVHIVQMERIVPEFADLIRMKGKVVYERN